MSLLVIGTLAYDSVETVHDRREGALGGSAVYFAVASSLLTPTALVGVVGKDFAEEDLAAAVAAPGARDPAACSAAYFFESLSSEQAVLLGGR